MNPIPGYRPSDIDRRTHEQDSEPPRAAQRRTDASEAHPVAHQAPDVLADTAHGRRFLGSIGKHAEVAPALQRLPLQTGLDTFRASLLAPYRTPSGPVSVAPPFRMPPGYADSEPTIARNYTATLRAALRVGLSHDDLVAIQKGRGTPEQIHRLTQALIDEQKPHAWTTADVRTLMWEHGIGMDCAGYAQQAYVAATGKSAAREGFDALAKENLGGLELRGFAKVNPADLRPGDVFVGPPPPGEDDPGHRAIVYDERPAIAAEVERLRSVFAARNPKNAFFKDASKDQVFRIEVDSSWGCGGYREQGGAQRRTWWYDRDSKMWACEIPNPAGGSWLPDPGTDAYNHPGFAFVRRRGEP